MSSYVTGEVWKRFPDGSNRLIVMHALADHAHDDGTHVFPSVGYTAMKSRISKRTVQRVLKEFLEEGWLILEEEKTGRGNVNHYRINMEKLLACACVLPERKKALRDSLSPFTGGALKGDNSAQRVTTQQERVTTTTLKGDTCVTQNSNIKQEQDPDPSVREISLPKTKTEWAHWFHVKHKFSPDKAKHPNNYPMYQSFLDRGVTFEQVEQAIEYVKSKNIQPTTPNYYAGPVEDVLNAKHLGGQGTRPQIPQDQTPKSDDDYQATELSELNWEAK